MTNEEKALLDAAANEQQVAYIKGIGMKIGKKYIGWDMADAMLDGLFTEWSEVATNNIKAGRMRNGDRTYIATGSKTIMEFDLEL